MRHSSALASDLPFDDAEAEGQLNRLLLLTPVRPHPGFRPAAAVLMKVLASLEWCRQYRGIKTSPFVCKGPAPGSYVANGEGALKDVWVLEPMALLSFLQN